MVVHNAGTSPLLDLPEELLTMIVECCASYKDGYPNMLANLRLVHPRLAHLRYIEKQVFRQIRFAPEPNQLKGLQAILSRIGPLVRHVIFCAARDVVTHEQQDECDHYANNYRAAEISSMVDDGSATQIMGSMLRSMPGIHQVTVDEHRKAHDGVTWLGPSYYRISDIAAQCFKSVASRTDGFSLTYRGFETPPWRYSPTQHAFDTTGLKSLRFAILFRPPFTRYNLVEAAKVARDKEKFLGETAAVTNSLMKKNAATLTQLSLENPDYIFGAQFDTILMPSLQSLELNCCALHLDSFQRWLLRSTNLKRLTLDRVRKSRGGHRLSDWRPLFSAIRHHNESLHLNCIHIELRWTLHSTLSFIHPKPRSWSQTFSGQNEVVQMLQNYMSKQAAWYLDAGWER